VVLTPCINFLPKNLSPEEAQGRLRTYTIMALTSSVDARDTEEGLLCPVRALRTYIDRVATFRQGRWRLFLSTRAPHAQITKHTVSAWIKRVIKWVYESSTEEERRLGNVRAHDIRGFATSWAFTNSVPLLEVLRAGTWRHHSTFSDFYLKDVGSSAEGISPCYDSCQIMPSVVGPVCQHLHKCIYLYITMRTYDRAFIRLGEW
jgi:hypothetical protein